MAEEDGGAKWRFEALAAMTHLVVWLPGQTTACSLLTWTHQLDPPGPWTLDPGPGLGQVKLMVKELESHFSSSPQLHQTRLTVEPGCVKSTAEGQRSTYHGPATWDQVNQRV